MVLLRQGQIAVATGDLVDGYHRLAAPANGSGPIADEARSAARAIADEAARQIAARPRERAYVGVLRNGETRIVHGP